MSKPKKPARHTAAPSMLDGLRDAAKRHAARRLGNPDADVSPTPDDYIGAARDTGNAVLLAAVREELAR